MSPSRVEALGLLLALAGAISLITAAALVAAPLAFLTAGLLGFPLGLRLVLLAARAPATPKAGDQP